MPNLVPSDGQAGLRKVQSRQLSRHIANLDVQTRLAAAQIDAIAETQAKKIQAIGYVAQRAQLAAGILSKVEESVVLFSPLSSGRVAMIGDVACIGMVEVVADTTHLVR